MGILFLLGVYPNYGGVEKVTTVIANSLVKRGHNVSIASFEQPHPEIKDAELDSSVNLYKLDKPVLSPKCILTLRRILRENNIDIIVNQWAIPFYVVMLCKLAAINMPCRLVSVYHNLPNTNNRIKKVEADISSNKGINAINRLKLSLVTFISRLSMKYIIGNSDKYVVLSPSLIRIAKDFGYSTHATNIAAIPNPLTLSAPKTTSFKKKKVLYVGRIEYYQKRVDRVIDIWKELENSGYNDWELHIVGDGPDRQDIQNRIDSLELKRAHIEGYCNPQLHYEDSQILLLTSDYEGFGLVIVEGMAHGVIPIVYGSYPTVYDIIDNETNGYITPYPYRQIDFVNKLKELMQNETLRTKLSNNAINKSKTFELQSIIDTWENLFKELK